MGCSALPATHLEVVQRLHLHDRAHRVERQGYLHSLVGAEWCMDLEGGSRGQAEAGEREAPAGMAGGTGADVGWGAPQVPELGRAAAGRKPLQQAGCTSALGPGQTDKFLTPTLNGCVDGRNEPWASCRPKAHLCSTFSSGLHTEQAQVNVALLRRALEELHLTPAASN